MKNKNLILTAFLHATGVAAYIVLVAWLLSNGEKVFGQEPNFLIPVFMLLLFVTSATITGLLVLGRPIHYYISGFKQDAIKLLVATVAWLFLYAVAVGLVMVF